MNFILYNSFSKFFIFCVLFSISWFLFFHAVLADDYTSPSFRVRNPILQIASSTTMSSPSFRLLGTVGQIAIGSSLSTSFKVLGGSLYYPIVSSQIVSATAGNGQVSLSWTAAVGNLGWTVSGYNMGQATVSGGPYTFSSSLGNVTSSTRTGLMNGTTYYFIIRAEDALGNSIATSSEVSSTPVAPTPTPTPSPTLSGPTGGGGGGGGYAATGITFSGRAYPLSKVNVLKDGQLAITTIAGPDANFNISLSGLSSGNYIFAVFGEDSHRRRSTLFTFPIFITSGAATNISGIFIAPTIDVDKSEVKRGENIAIFGQSVPNAEITISVNSDEEFFNKVKADESGVYLYNFDTTPLAMEQHFTKSKTILDGNISSFSKVVSFMVGIKTVLAQPTKAPAKGDLSGDGHVDLIDFSIAAYWYKRPSPPATVDLNGDGKVDLIDFSIMAFYWTG